MPKKKSSPSGQLSLFDIILDSVETLKKENEIEEQQTRSILYGNRQSTSGRGNSETDSLRRNYAANAQVSGIQHNLAENTGQMGIEQSGKVERTGKSRNDVRGDEIFTASENRSGSEGNRGILQPFSAGNERMGDIPGNEHQHRALKNYVISESDNIGLGTPKQKYQDNIKAIKTLQMLRNEQRTYATEEEQKILVKYVGWGGLPQAFDEKNEQWHNEYLELKNLLSDEDYANARRSTQDAHFTPKNVIDTIYQGLKRLGVNSEVDVLEPSAGIGNFIGFKPQDFKANFCTIEKDSISADILAYLYPNEKNLKLAYQDAGFAVPLFDVAIGNPPFGQINLYDKNFPRINFSIHNYFIAKSMELVKEGGIGAFVVSRHFLDSKNSKHREFIAENSHFLGAIRLPNNVFKENALTEVTTDIVFFQKKTEHEKQNNIIKGYDWINLDKKSIYNKKLGNYEQGYLNEFFCNNANQILGKLEYGHGKFDTDLDCISQTEDISKSLADALTVLPKNVYQLLHTESAIKQQGSPAKNRILSTEYYQNLKEHSLFEDVGKKEILIKSKNHFKEDDFNVLPLKTATAFQRIKGMIQIRDTLRSLINMEKSENPDLNLMERKRKELNIQYDHFVKKYGYLNSQVNRNLFNIDPEATLLQSIEFKYDKGISKEVAQKTGKEPKEPSAEKAPIFSRRVLRPFEKAVSADSSKEALLISLRETGKIDFNRMSELTGTPQDELKKELNGTLIFENPKTREWETADKYLAGNIRKKLQEAEQFSNGNNKYLINTEALKRVMPDDIEPVDIGVRFGSTWVPATDVKNFIKEKMGEFSPYKDPIIDYIPVVAQWNVNFKFMSRTVEEDIWGTPEYPASKIVKALLENTPIRVMRDAGVDNNGNIIKELDSEATSAAMQKAEAIQQEFKDWIWENEERRDRLAKIYNETFNTNVPVQYDGSHIELIGASTGVSLRPHQKNVIWRSIQEGTALFDHVVGAGKTLATVATIKESKRMGFIKKPMVVVPNHLVYQWRDEFYKLYPDANILVADKADFLKENRERFFGRIATGEWDAVIIPHSSFKKIDMPADMQKEILQEQINAVESSLAALQTSNDSSNKATVKQLERQKERMKEKLMRTIESNGQKGKNIDFSDLGVDALFVDEAHEFKNLGFTTSLSVSGLGNIQGSAKALDLFVKCRYLQKKHDGKGVYFLTGTPISNTIAEVYTMQRYLQYDVLKEKGIEYFDAWASTFGKITSNWELDATGVNYKLKSRFASFNNVPELLAMYRTFADVVTKKDIDEQTQKQGLRSLTPPILSGKPINIIAERSPYQADYMNEIISRMEKPNKDSHKDNPLKITNDARKAGLDYRLVNPYADDFANSKVNLCVEKIYEIWEQSKAVKGTQLVFCDLSTPKGITNIQTTRNEEDEEPGEEIDTVNMDELLAYNPNFSVYNDLKEKLIKKGIPEEEIAFIHSANNDAKKSKLFADVNSGDIRILLGSTGKMGAGMNVQERLVAAHHLDAPWRPSDLEQRNGRIIRQGNKLYEADPDNFKIQIYNYATKQTYDARMWQTIEYKAGAIEQFRRGDILQRSIDDIQSEAANAAEMKAAASGNPLILLEVSYNTEKRKLEALYNQHQKAQHRLDSSIKYLEKADERFEKATQRYKAAVSLRDENSAAENYFVTNDGTVLKDKELLKEKLTELVFTASKEVSHNIKQTPCIGKYRGFNVFIHHRPSEEQTSYYNYVLTTPDGTEYSSDSLVYEFGKSFQIPILFGRFDKILDEDIEQSFETSKINYANDKHELVKAKELKGQEFKFMDELQVTRLNHNAVLRELNFIQSDSNYVSKFEPLTVEKYREQKAQEQKIIPGVKKEQSKGLAL